MHKYLIILFLLATPFFSIAQDFRGGILGGFVASQVDGDQLVGYNKSGFHAGIFVKNSFTDKTGFSVEIKFIQKGSRKISKPNETAYYKLRLNYIEVPFIFEYYFKKSLIFQGGLGFAYLINAKEDADGSGFIEPSPAFNKFEFPFIAGVVYKFTDNFYGNLRYSYSISPIRTHPGYQTYYFDRGQYNNLLSAGILVLI